MSFFHRIAVVLGIRRNPPPLHRHALESILGFCSLRDLSVAARVSREWRAATHSMGSIGAHFAPQVPVSQLTPSRLFTRHIGSLSNNALVPALADLSDWAVGVAALSFLAACPQLNHSLRELQWSVPKLSAVLHGASQVGKTEWSQLVLPSHLHRLKLDVQMQLRTADAAALFHAIAQLSELRILSLYQRSPTDVFDFTPLKALTRLESLELMRSPHTHALSEDQINQLRSIAAVRADGSALHKLALLPLDTQQLGFLLAPGHAMRLQTMDLLTRPILEDSGKLFKGLAPSLTSLSLAFCGSNLDFLADISVLRSLTLDLISLPPSTPIAVLARGLHARSSSLTELVLGRWNGPRAEDVVPLLLPLRSLTSLSLLYMANVASLGFFASLPELKSNLRSLNITHCSADMSGAELPHLHGMLSLESLTLILSRRNQLSIRQMADYSSPSAELPSLRSFRYWS